MKREMKHWVFAVSLLISLTGLIVTGCNTSSMTNPTSQTSSQVVPGGSLACTSLPVWSADSVAYAVGAQVVYGTEIFQCAQAHTSQASWTPPATPALWKDLGPCSGPTSTPTPVDCSAATPWGSGVAYAVGSQVTFNGELFRCLQAHTSQTNWTPPAVPALWQDRGACTLTACVPGPNPGATWTEASANIDPASTSSRAGHTVLTFNGKLWVIAGAANTSAGDPNVGRDVWSSTDGFHWTQVTGNAAFGFRSNHTSVVMVDPADGQQKMWVIGGATGITLHNDVWNSTDGVNWKQVLPDQLIVTNRFGERANHVSFVFDAGNGPEMWVIGGFDGVNAQGDVWHSKDGVNWSLPSGTSSGFLGPRFASSAVVFDGGPSTSNGLAMWIIGGVTLQGTALGAANDVWYSKDGANWVQVVKNAAFLPRDAQASVVFNNKMWVMHGSNSGVSLRDVWSSPNGVNWTEETTAGGAEPLQSAASVFNSRMWMVAGGTFPAVPTLTDVWFSGCGN